MTIEINQRIRCPNCKERKYKPGNGCTHCQHHVLMWSQVPDSIESVLESFLDALHHMSIAFGVTSVEAAQLVLHNAELERREEMIETIWDESGLEVGETGSHRILN